MSINAAVPSVRRTTIGLIFATGVLFPATTSAARDEQATRRIKSPLYGVEYVTPPGWQSESDLRADTVVHLRYVGPQPKDGPAIEASIKVEITPPTGKSARECATEYSAVFAGTVLADRVSVGNRKGIAVSIAKPTALSAFERTAVFVDRAGTVFTLSLLSNCDALDVAFERFVSGITWIEFDSPATHLTPTRDVNVFNGLATFRMPSLMKLTTPQPGVDFTYSVYDYRRSKLGLAFGGYLGVTKRGQSFVTLRDSATAAMLAGMKLKQSIRWKAYRGRPERSLSGPIDLPPDPSTSKEGGSIILAFAALSGDRIAVFMFALPARTSPAFASYATEADLILSSMRVNQPGRE
jgi:hypothetical protein